MPLELTVAVPHAVAMEDASIPLDVGAISSDVRNGKERNKFVDNGALVSLTPLPRGQRSGICRDKGLSPERRRAENHQWDIQRGDIQRDV